jgi:xylem cysteine proteinase
LGARNGIHPSIRVKFNKWTKAHQVTFKTPAEMIDRLTIFNQIDSMIEAHNAQESSYKLGHNQFSAMTDVEVTKYLGLKMPENYERKTTLIAEVDVQQTSLDWRDKGAVGDVKNQASCGSCWAFSATAAVEGFWKLSGKNLENLAEQQLVDCATNGNYGCNGGWMDYAFQYLISAKGQVRTASYPYTALDGDCKFKQSDAVAYINGFDDVGKSDCKQLLSFNQRGPVSVAIAATREFMQYTNGVFSSGACGTGLNHGVTLVGYGTDDSLKKDFYIVRNSWGAGWGEKGYVRMDRNVQTASGICGICLAASIPK